MKKITFDAKNPSCIIVEVDMVHEGQTLYKNNEGHYYMEDVFTGKNSFAGYTLTQAKRVVREMLK